jgi:hypothetical protein
MKKKFYTAIAIIAFIGLSNASFAQSSHPREAEVNQRIDNQTSRIDNKFSASEINRPEAYHLQNEDRRIGREENRFENRHDGCITRPEQARLNHQENRVNRQIRRW